MAMNTTSSGLQYEDTRAGTGASPARGQECVMHYTGWLWVNGVCIPKVVPCPKGYVGKFPNCKKIEEPPRCPRGYVGKWPDCEKIGHPPPKKCKPGYVGKWPNCKKIVIPPQKCPKGTIGKWPNCKKLTLKPNKTIKDVQKAIKKLQILKKKNND